MNIVTALMKWSQELHFPLHITVHAIRQDSP